MRKKYEKEQNYTKAKLLKYKFDALSKQEHERQGQHMREAQQQELIAVEEAQRMQFSEFAAAWDKYMADYEATAFESVERLKEKHIREIQELHERVSQQFTVKFKWSRELMELRKQEKIFFSIRDYQRAEDCRLKADKQESFERQQSSEQLSEAIARQERVLRQKQQLALATLLKRIQRDREEQMKHRAEDSKRLMQRNANLLKDMLNKQTQEQRKTEQFLKFALGKREVKTEEEIKQQIRDSKYSPSSDPLMARSIRKYNPKISTYKNNPGSGRVHTTDSRLSKMVTGNKFAFDFKSPLHGKPDDGKRQTSLFLINKQSQSRQVNPLNKT